MTNRMDDPNSASGKRIDPALCDFIADTPISEPNDGWAAESFTIEGYRSLPEYDPETIERCAQVAESYDGYISAPSPKAMAAAIRALKDKP